MEKILNKRDFKNQNSVNKYRTKSQSKESKELDLNYSLHNKIKKLSNNKRFNKLKKQKKLNKFFEKYFT